MAVPKRQDMCPTCYLNDEKDVPLQYNLGSTKPLQCGSGHVFEDREELSTLTHQMIEQKKALAPKAEPQPPVDEILPPVDEENKIGNSTNPIQVNIRSMVISAIDMERITGLIGTFRDSSTLFGTIYALTQELAETKELLKRAMDAKAVSRPSGPPGTVRAIGGDALIQVIIPERWVGPIKDIAEANGMDSTRYMNARIEDGLDNQWFS